MMWSGHADCNAIKSIKAMRKVKAGNERRRATEPGPVTEVFLTYKIGRLRKIFDRQYAPQLAEKFGLTLADWRVLSLLYTSSPATASRLRQRLFVDRAEISRALQRLDDRGLIRRVPDENDRRSVGLMITAKGKALHDKVLPLREAVQVQVASCLSQTELKNLHSALDKLLDFHDRKASEASSSSRRKRALDRDS
jgi:DNA-binding MarR family transcriptional regulator